MLAQELTPEPTPPIEGPTERDFSGIVLTVGEFLVALLGSAVVGGGFIAIGLAGVVRSVGRDKDQLDRLEHLATELIPVEVLDRVNSGIEVIKDIVLVLDAVTDRLPNEPVFSAQRVSDEPCSPCDGEG